MFNLLIALAIAWSIYTTTNHYNEKHCTDDGCTSWHENQYSNLEESLEKIILDIESD